MIIKKRYLLYLLSIIVLVCCSKEQDADIKGSFAYSPEFYAGIENAQTKTYVNDALKSSSSSGGASSN